LSRIAELADRIESREARMGVIGLGYVGLPLAVAFARAGFRVTGFEVDTEKVQAIAEGRSYIEDVNSDDLARARREERLEASGEFSALAACDVIHVCVPTPLTKAKDPDFSHLARAVEEIRKRLRAG
jgi:UDP-N-acetyl-D-glucosamine dehydrogenase